MVQKKICMLGSFAVGKTSLVRRFVSSMFSEKYQTTIGVKIDKKQVHVDGQVVDLLLWDIEGEHELAPLRMSYLQGASGYLLVADGTRPATLDKALELKARLEKAFGSAPFLLIFNKCDLAESWNLSTHVEKKLAGSGWQSIRASAKTGSGVDEAFLRLAKMVLVGA